MSSGETQGSPYAVTTTMDYLTIQTTGNMADFGDLQAVGGSREGMSNGHGGLG